MTPPFQPFPKVDLEGPEIELDKDHDRRTRALYGLPTKKEDETPEAEKPPKGERGGAGGSSPAS